MSPKVLPCDKMLVVSKLGATSWGKLDQNWDGISTRPYIVSEPRGESGCATVKINK